MPWSQLSPMDQKKQLVEDYFRGVLTGGVRKTV
jgi:hypothetical protein